MGAVVFGGGLAPVLLLFGLKAAPAASVSLWLNLEVVATTLLATAFFHEYTDTALTVGLIFLGGLSLTAHEGAAGVRAGALVALACVCWGLDNNFTAIVPPSSRRQLVPLPNEPTQPRKWSAWFEEPGVILNFSPSPQAVEPRTSATGGES